jgi:hypothetical protein
MAELLDAFVVSCCGSGSSGASGGDGDTIRIAFEARLDARSGGSQEEECTLVIEWR